MDTSGVLTMGIGLLIILCILVFAIEMFLPLNIKVHMQDIMRPYMFQLEAQGSLSPSELEQIKVALEEAGLTEVEVNIHYEGYHFGDQVTCITRGKYSHKGFTQLFRRTDSEIEMSYEKTLYIRKIKN